MVVAHPDDEAIGAGGVIAAARLAGAPVSVVVVTNGDSNRLSAAMLTRTLRPKAEQQRVGGRVRQQETLAALEHLGVPGEGAIFFGFPDRVLDQVLGSERPVRSPSTGFDSVGYDGTRAPGASYTRTVLLDLMRGVVAEVRPTMIVTHLPFDRHPDHRAIFQVVEAVRGDVPVYGFLVHAAGYPRPLRLAAHAPLLPPRAMSEMPGWTWMRFDLSPELSRVKQEAINAHRSQIITPYLRLLLASFVRTNELFASRP